MIIIIRDETTVSLLKKYLRPSDSSLVFDLMTNEFNYQTILIINLVIVCEVRLYVLQVNSVYNNRKLDHHN